MLLFLISNFEKSKKKNSKYFDFFSKNEKMMSEFSMILFCINRQSQKYETLHEERLGYSPLF